MSERVSENIVILLDTSRSMFKADYKPNRLYCCINAVKALIKQRFDNDGKSAFAIVNFSDQAKIVTDFTNSETELFKGLASSTIGGRSNMGDGIALSIKTLIGELRKVLVNFPRILVISDGTYTQTAIDPIKMVLISRGIFKDPMTPKTKIIGVTLATILIKLIRIRPIMKTIRNVITIKRRWIATWPM